ncbi:DegT/DnrJ/EryC1/StrS family aminotransferase [soil metagenome]
MSKLAVFGGPKAVPIDFKPYTSVGPREAAAVARVMASGTLSAFYGLWCDQFFGGPEVQAFEKAWSERFRVRHTVSVNSATSGLIAAMGAVGVTPGSEVIVPPYTMSATAVAPLFYGGIPVFVDIEPDTFNLDVGAVKKAITPKTKAILAVNLLGHPANLAELRALADANGIKLVEDNAQSVLTKENGRYAGTIGHIGVFSLNYHKHIHTGEGGMCTTDDDDLARRLQMIRNHGENSVEPLGYDNPTNLIGQNYRMSELHAAIGIEQLAAADEHVSRRVRIAERLTEAAQGLEGLTPPVVRDGCTHAYYVWAMKLDAKKLGVSRAAFVKALEAEGFPIAAGYHAPLYLLPVFQKRIAFGTFPFNLTERTYAKGMCPVTERMEYEELVCYQPCVSDVDDAAARLLGTALRKVHQHRDELAARASELEARAG